MNNQRLRKPFLHANPLHVCLSSYSIAWRSQLQICPSGKHRKCKIQSPIRTCPFQNIEFEMSISFLQFWEPTGQSSVTVFYDFSATDRKNDFHKNTFLRPGVNFEISGVLFITFCWHTNYQNIHIGRLCREGIALQFTAFFRLPQKIYKT